jgi:hypothetical protein
VWLQEFGKEEMRGGAAKGGENEGGLHKGGGVRGKGAARVREVSGPKHESRPNSPT